MLSAHSAEVIAFMGDGFIIHYDCLDDEQVETATRAMNNSGVDRHFYTCLEARFNLSPLSRYEIHTAEGERAYDIERSPIIYSELLQDAVDEREVMDRTLDIFAAVRERLDSDGYDEKGQHHSDIEDLDNGVALIEDLRTDLDHRIEAEIDFLSAERCDECGERIE